MAAFSTSVLMNSLIDEAREESLPEENSGTMDRNTRRTTPQQRVSLMRMACVKKSRRDSRIACDVKQNFLMLGYEFA